LYSRGYNGVVRGRRLRHGWWLVVWGVVLVGVLVAGGVLSGSFAGVRAGAGFRVAVASNFAGVMRELAAGYERRTGNGVTLAFGSTGKLYAQIRNGAPYAAFFAADARRPALLESEGLAVRGTRFTYALGRLVLWSSREGYVDGSGEVLRRGEFRHLALASPRLAPYGRAAREVLESLGLWSSLRGRLVRGENVAQAYQFVRSGAAELGFVAYSQVVGGGDVEGSWWEPPAGSYGLIEQQAVQLGGGAVVREFLAYVRGPEGRRVIRAHGYGLP
jgi:molybdate transport system substrate-binding protein